MNGKQRYELQQQLIDLCAIQDRITHLNESMRDDSRNDEQIVCEQRNRRMAIANILVFVDTLIVTASVSTETVEQGATVIGVRLDRL